MLFSVQSQKIGGVAVIRCEGRLVVSEGVRLLQEEVEKHTLETKKYLLDLGALSYIDSGGLGAMVRLLGTLRAERGDLKLCELSPFLMHVFEATDLKGIFHTHQTEREAIQAFSHRPQESVQVSRSSRPKVICVDSS